MRVTAPTFAALGVSEPVAQALLERGFKAPFQIQELVLPEALQGADILAKSPTGSGKTLAFGIPVVERARVDGHTPTALILVPTRELAQQVVEELESLAKARGLHIAAVYGGGAVMPQAKKVKGAQILVATPGRLQDLADRRLIHLDSVETLVLDEADRMLDMGFKPQVERILRLVPHDRQTMLFSATLDGEVGVLAREYTQHPAYVEAELPRDLEQGEVDHKFVPVTADTKIDVLIDHLNQIEDGGQALVFVRTKRGADRLMSKLVRAGMPAIALHGDMSQNAREHALEQFRNGKAKTLIATDVAARGLDIDTVTHVINFDPPEDDKGYVHRVGRTGRAGRDGSGITFVLPEQQAEFSRVAARLGHKESFEQEGLTTAKPKLLYTSRRGRRSRW
jgi:ATP-dependent RNA helicase RhlE